MHHKDILWELISALENRSSALGTYFRSLSKNEIKELFKEESIAFLRQGIAELVYLEDYEICAAFCELMEEKQGKLVFENV